MTLACSLNRIQLFATPWTVARQAPLSMEFSRQEWSGLPFLLQGIFPAQGSNAYLLQCRQILYHCATWEAHVIESLKLRAKKCDLYLVMFTTGLP